MDFAGTNSQKGFPFLFRLLTGKRKMRLDLGVSFDPMKGGVLTMNEAHLEESHTETLKETDF